MTDTVNHPAHYTAHPSGVECITITEHMSFTLGNAVKYIWRADLKGNALEDLKKAAWYIQHEIERLEKADTERQLNLSQGGPLAGLRAQGGPVRRSTSYLIGESDGGVEARPDWTPDVGTVALSDLVAYLDRAAQYNAERAVEHEKRGRTAEAEQNLRARWAYDDAAAKLRTALDGAL